MLNAKLKNYKKNYSSRLTTFFKLKQKNIIIFRSQITLARNQRFVGIYKAFI